MMRSLLAVLLMAPLPALAETNNSDQGSVIEIGQPWAPATPPVARVGAGYATIINRAELPDRLLGAETPTAGRVEVHQMGHDNGQMTMRPLPGGAEIPAGGVLELQPGGVHLMFMELSQPLTQGATIPVTLEFQQAGRIEAQFTIRPAAHHGHVTEASHSH